MFEDLKDKIQEYNPEIKENSEVTALLPNAEKLKQEGLDTENFTLTKLFPEYLDEEGNDLSLMSGAEWEFMVTYSTMRKYLIEKYPQSQQEAKMLGQVWDELPCRLMSLKRKKIQEANSSLKY